MENVLGLVVAGSYVLVVLGVASLLARRGMSSEGSRKFVHIALGGWWLVAAWFFSSPWWAAVLPAIFIVVNAYAYRSRQLSFMSREEAEDTPGTVYYAVSLTLLAWFSFWIGAPYVGALGMFCMSFGDGFAAVLGKRYGNRMLIGGRKSLVGSASMLAISFVSCVVVLLLPAPFGAGLEGVGGGVGGVLLAGAVLAVVATVLELFSSDGLDNLTVPLGVTTLYVAAFLPVAVYTPLFVGVLLSGAIAVASLWLHLLTLPGALGAVVVGAAAFAIGSWPLWLLLMWFFGSSNVASKIMARRKRHAERALAQHEVRAFDAEPEQGRKTQGVSKGTAQGKKSGSPRKLRQVLANSVPFLVCALVYAATGEPWFLVVSAGALAACTADTWASEIGTYSKKPPVNILTRQPMQRGLSGGVSPLGLVATVMGSFATALLAVLLFRAFGFAAAAGLGAFLFIVACGIVGSLVDSVLGVLLQAKYRPPEKDGTVLVESSPAHHAAGYTLVSGYAWVTNDAVNFMSGIAVVALGLLVV